MKEELKAADAAMFATANPSVGGFDVRGLTFDVKTNKPEGTTSVHRGLPSTAGELRAECFPTLKLRRASEIGRDETGDQ